MGPSSRPAPCIGSGAPVLSDRADPRLPARLELALDVATVAQEPLSEEERYYTERARASNTRRGYRSDLADFAGWCTTKNLVALPAEPTTVTAYLVALARAGAKVATMGRRLSSISYAHRFAGVANPVGHPRVQGVWEGIRREHAQDVDQAPPLMPPVLWDVLGVLPADLSGIRDRALILVGFVGALRRSELAAIVLEDLEPHPKGMVLRIPRSKTDQHGAGQVVVLPASSRPGRCPVASLQAWCSAGGVSSGPVFRPVRRGGHSAGTRAMGEAAINRAVQRACERALGSGADYTAHSLRAGFATYAAQRGAPDRAIAHQTRHRSMASLGQYIRTESAWSDNAATALDL